MQQESFDIVLFYFVQSAVYRYLVMLPLPDPLSCVLVSSHVMWLQNSIII